MAATGEGVSLLVFCALRVAAFAWGLHVVDGDGYVPRTCALFQEGVSLKASRLVGPLVGHMRGVKLGGLVLQVRLICLDRYWRRMGFIAVLHALATQVRLC